MRRSGPLVLVWVLAGTLAACTPHTGTDAPRHPTQVAAESVGPPRDPVTTTTSPPPAVTEPTTTTTTVAIPTTTRPHRSRTTHAASSSTTTTTTVPKTTTTATGTASGYSAADERWFVKRINALRSAEGVAPLAVDSGLASYARSWAKHMADTGTFAHSNIASLLGPWSTVGENIAWGSSTTDMMSSLTASSKHHENMVDPSFTHVGVGVFIDSQGRIWTCHDFAG